MKKIFTICLTSILFVCILSGCKNNEPSPEPSPSETLPVVESQSPEAKDLKDRSEEYITENLKMIYDENIGLDLKVYLNDEQLSDFWIIDPNGKEYKYSDSEQNEILGLYLGEGFVGCKITDTIKGQYKIKYHDVGLPFNYEVSYVEPIVYLDVSEPTSEGLSFVVNGLKNINGTWRVDAVNMEFVEMAITKDDINLPLHPEIDVNAEFISIAEGTLTDGENQVSYNLSETLAPGSYLLIVNADYILNASTKLSFLEVGPIDVVAPVVADDGIVEEVLD